MDYQGNRHVIDEMERAGLSRLLLVTSLGCGDSWQYLPERARAAFGHEVRLKSLAGAGCRQAPLRWTILRRQGCRMGTPTGQTIPEPGQERHGLVRRQDVAIRGLQTAHRPGGVRPDLRHRRFGSESAMIPGMATRSAQWLTVLLQR